MKPPTSPTTSPLQSPVETTLWVGVAVLVSYLDEESARRLHPCDSAQAGALADGHSVGGPRRREVQPGGQMEQCSTSEAE